jgi:hypothetical protein
MTPLIEGLIENKDIIEAVRDETAAILALELQHQFALAQAEGKEDAADYNVAVFLENARPFDGEQDSFPLVNVQLSKGTASPSSSRVDDQRTTATLFVDCYGCGVAGAAEQDGAAWDDKSAALRAWKTARLVRNILMAGQYAYLGMRGVVGSRFIASMEAGDQAGAENASPAIKVVRITFEVQFVEKSPQAEGVPFEGIAFRCEDKTGRVLVELDFDMSGGDAA